MLLVPGLAVTLLELSKEHLQIGLSVSEVTGYDVSYKPMKVFPELVCFSGTTFGMLMNGVSVFISATNKNMVMQLSAQVYC